MLLSVQRQGWGFTLGTPTRRGARNAYKFLRSGRVQVAGATWSATLLVCTRRCQSLVKVLLFRAGVHADCMLWAVHGSRWSVSDVWWDSGPTARNAVGSTLHLQQPDWQAAALRMVHRASGSALWALCYVPHTSPCLQINRGRKERFIDSIYKN